jgi:hypothetical protein
MRIVLILLAIFGGFVLVGMTLAPSEPTLRDWYIAQACPLLDRISTDLCAPVRRAARGAS